MKSGHFKFISAIVLGLFLIPFLSFGQTYLTNGLVAYYQFNGNAIDESGNGFNGIVSNCWYVPDRFGNSNDAIFITNSPTEAATAAGSVVIPTDALNSLNCGTITAWIMPSNITSGCILAKQHNGSGTLSFFIGGYCDSGGQYAAGSPGILYFHPQNSAPLASSTSVVTTQAWQQIAVVFTGTSCVFYINGVLCGTNTGNYSIPDDDVEPSIITSIGCLLGDGFGFPQARLVGAIDDVRIYNRAFSTSEVQQLYQTENNSGSPGSPLVGIGKAVFITFTNLSIGYNYQIQTSTDLNNWTNYSTPFTAIASSMTYSNYWQVANWNQLFFRLH
jgi:hypothetical protein